MRQLLSAIFTAMLLLTAGPALGDQEDDRLDDLFERLNATGDPIEGRLLTHRIWQIWLISEDPVTNELMLKGRQAMARQDAETALAAFNHIVDREPDFAEGWNKRATLYYTLGDYQASIADITRTLALEQRHFGALAGLGMVFDAQNDKRHALQAYRSALDANPHLADVKARIHVLEKEIAGGI